MQGCLLCAGIGSLAAYLQEIKEMDGLLKERSKKKRGSYLRVCELPGLLDPTDIAWCSKLLSGWENSGKQELALYAAVQNPFIKHVLNHAFCRLEQEFKIYSHPCSESMVKNFLIKIIFWTQRLLEPMLLSWDGKNTDKFVFHGKVKKQEYLFCLFLTMLGIDVLLLLPEGDITLETNLLEMSEKIILGLPQPTRLPHYEPKEEPAAAVIIHPPIPVVVKTAPTSRTRSSSAGVRLAKQEELEKVVAIGSPLGLFNSVSDGIISGFREIHDVDMIQFTAPISHGSSGGAVLNMYGEVIGISTAGFDSGQNINLAVDYKNISKFIAGFT